MRKITWAIVVFLSAGLVSSFAGGQGEQKKPANTPAGQQLYVFIPKSLDNPYWDECRKGMEAKAAELGVKAEFIGPATADASKQADIFESVIARHPNGIAVSPNDPKAIASVIDEAIAAKIPVICWDSDAASSKRIAYVGTDNTAAGSFAGKEMGKVLNGQGTVAILHGSLTAQNAIERVNGFTSALSTFPGIKIVATETTEESPTISLSKAESLLQAYPDLSAFYGVTGVGVPGAGNAVLQAGKAGVVKVVGFDVVPQGIDLMKKGAVQALVSQRPFGMTGQALQILFDINQGKMPDKKIYDTGVLAVYPDTLDDFLKTSH